MTEKEVYQFYNDKVKIIYSEVEARNNTLPVELLFEIHSAFDHLKRLHVDGEDENLSAQKAYSHLKRGVLDAFKLKLKYFNDDYSKLINKKADLRIIDSGTYLTDLLKDRKRIVDAAKSARLNEAKQDIDEAFENWCITSEQINEFEQKYFDSEKIKWAERQSFFHFNANFWLGVVSGIVSSILFTLLMKAIA